MLSLLKGCCGCCGPYEQVKNASEYEVSFKEDLAAWKESNGNPRMLRWRGKKRPNDAWPEAQAPTDDAISHGIANRINSELAALRLAVFSSRALDGTKTKRPSVAPDFAEHLQKLKMLMLVGKVDLRVESVNKQTGTGVYNFVDTQLDGFAGKETSAAVLQVERPADERSNVWKVSFIPGGRVRMDTYALMLQRLIAWRFFTPSDKFEGEGIPRKWMPTGAEVQEVALQTSMRSLSFRFLRNVSGVK